LARHQDFGPRVFAWLAGWGDVVMPGVHGYFWIPIVGPVIGSVVGAIVYDFFIRDVLKARGEQPEQDVELEGRTIKGKPETYADDSHGSHGHGSASTKDFMIVLMEDCTRSRFDQATLWAITEVASPRTDSPCREW
jgi:hypothetical protein